MSPKLFTNHTELLQYTLICADLFDGDLKNVYDRIRDNDGYLAEFKTQKDRDVFASQIILIMRYVEHGMPNYIDFKKIAILFGDDVYNAIKIIEGICINSSVDLEVLHTSIFDFLKSYSNILNAILYRKFYQTPLDILAEKGSERGIKWYCENYTGMIVGLTDSTIDPERFAEYDAKSIIMESKSVEEKLIYVDTVFAAFCIRNIPDLLEYYIHFMKRNRKHIMRYSVEMDDVPKHKRVYSMDKWRTTSLLDLVKHKQFTDARCISWCLRQYRTDIMCVEMLLHKEMTHELLDLISPEIVKKCSIKEYMLSKYVNWYVTHFGIVDYNAYYYGLCINGDLEKVKSIAAPPEFDASNMYHRDFKVSNRFQKAIINKYDLDFYPKTLKSGVCDIGNVEILKWILGIYGDLVEITKLFNRACAFGNLDMINWMFLKYPEIQANPMTVAFQIACIMGNVNVVKFIYSVRDIKPKLAFKVIKKCKNKQLLDWLIKKYVD